MITRINAQYFFVVNYQVKHSFVTSTWNKAFIKVTGLLEG